MKSILIIVGIILVTGAIYIISNNNGHDHHGHDHHGHDHHGHDHGSHQKKGGHGHHHTAPHGGCLVVFGNEFAHVEILVDEKSGKTQVYILDGEAKNGLPISQESLKLNIKHGNLNYEITLKAQENSLSGEKLGNTSQFIGEDTRLKNIKEFDAILKTIEIRGQKFENTSFSYPKGNEYE